MYNSHRNSTRKPFQSVYVRAKIDGWTKAIFESKYKNCWLGAYGIFDVQENYSIKAYDSYDQQMQIQWFFYTKKWLIQYWNFVGFLFIWSLTCDAI